MTVKISIKDLYKSFPKKNILNGIDLDIESSKSMVIIGGSGSGKSVLLKTIIGLINADSGQIIIDGKDITSINQREHNNLMKKFGVLFQGGALFDSLPIWHNIAFGLIESGTNIDKAKSIAMDKLNSVGLENRVANLFPSELSGGMQKRVALARAIAGDPTIILFDEPTTGLDPIMSNVINNLIVKCSKELGATTITITHDMNSVRQIADTVAMLHSGKIVWQGAADQIDITDNQYIKQFISGQVKGPIKIDA